MDTDGYLVLPSFANPNPMKQAILPYKDKTQYIFNGTGQNDHKRKQVRLPVFLVEELRKKIRALPFVGSQHLCNHFVLLRSLPGCARQAAHTDYVPDPVLFQCEPKEKPLLFLFAIEDDTKLVVWPGSHKVVQGRGRTMEPIFPKVLTLSAGDAVVFRSDLVHAGAEYETENLRIHCYIDSEIVPRPQNRTWIIQKHADTLVKEKILETPKI